MSNSLIYAPYRSLGVICGEVSLAVTKLGEELFFTVPCGNSFQVYRADKLQVVLISKPAPGPITHLCANNHDTFISVQNSVYRYRRAHLMNKIVDCSSEVKGLHCLGDLLLCYDADNNLLVYNLQTMNVVSSLKLLHRSAVSAILHPATYLNKFIIAYDDGHLELWNIKTCKLIHVFQSVARKVKAMCGGAGVAVMSQSPASDIVAVGFSSGDVMILNIKLDVVLFHFRQKGAVSGISFRADLLTAKFPYILTSSEHGHVFIWNIENTDNDSMTVVKLVTTILQAHHGCIVSLQFLPSEPVFVTSGADNAIKLWIFDNPDGSARLLKHRQGLSKYPKKMRYFGDVSSSNIVGQEVYSIISGAVVADADGRLLFTRTEKDYDFQELSARNVDSLSKGRLSECVDFDFTYVGSKPWGDMVSVHKDKSEAYLWKLEDKASTKTVLKYPGDERKKSSTLSSASPTATAVKVSNCGNFSVIGYANGVIAKFNIQSGKYRGQFNDERYSAAVLGAVNGLYLDAANLVLISIHDNGHLVNWDFQTSHIKHIQHLPSRLLRLVGSNDSIFIAVADSDSVIRLFDLETLKICRIFRTQHSAEISDMVFTADMRRLLSSSLDSCLQVWDISTSQRISWCRFSAPLTSLSLTPSGDLLVAKYRCKDVLLCADRSLVEGIEHIANPDSPIDLSEFTSSSSLKVPESRSKPSETEEEHVPEKEEEEVDEESGLTLSSISKSYWTALCNLELLQKRNKLVKPIEKISIPFFLPLTSQQIEGKGQKSEITVSDKITGSKILKRKTVYRSKVLELLSQCEVSDSRTQKEFLAYLMSLSPSELDIQLQSLMDYDTSLEGDTVNNDAMKQFLVILEAQLKTRRNFEFIQALLHRVLAVHSQGIVEDPSLLQPLQRIQSSQSASGQSLQNMLHLTLCLTKSLLSIPMC